MVYHVYTLFDKVIGKYLPAQVNSLPPEQFKETTIDAAKHGYIENCSDMELYYLGTFDNVTGLCDTGKPVYLVYLGEFVTNDTKD